MEVKEYGDFMSTSKVYSKLPIIYPILGMNGEAGEAAEKVKKCLRDNNGEFDEHIKQDLLKELADVLWYIWATADDMNHTLEDVMHIGMKKVKERQETNTVHGTGDNREESRPIDFNNHEDILSEGYDADFPEYSNNYIESKTPRSIIKLLGDFDSLKKISYKLLYSHKKDVHIILKDHNEQFEYDGKFMGLGRLDGGLLIKLNDESKTKELIENIHDNVSGLPYYMCEINGDLLLERRAELIPIICE